MAGDITHPNEPAPIGNLYLLHTYRNHRSQLTMSMSQQLATTAKNSEIQIDDRTFLVLKNNLYKEAKSDESIKMVFNYCTSRNIDPLLKAVHIVPMWNKNTGKEEDTIMPGIGLYRIIAARSGHYAGMSEPTFGPMVTDKVGSITITYPEWCMVIVKKFIQGHIVEFPAKEYWIENYAGKGKDPTPNAMWQKRKFGQLAKCAEAQALRKAFPEVGYDYTYEELQGKTFDHEDEPKKSFDVVRPLTVKQIINEPVDLEEYDFDKAVIEMDGCLTFEELTKVYTAHFMEAKKRRDVGARSKLVSAYAKKKSSLESSDALASEKDIQEFLEEYDSSTGEVAEVQV